MTEAPITPQPGDLVFCHSSGLVGKAIRLGEWLRFRRGDQYNHVAIVNERLANGAWTVIQAEARGVTATGLLSDITPGGRFDIVRPPGGILGDDVREFALEQVGDRYGWVTIVSIVATLISPRFLNVMRPFTWICSAVSAESLRFAGWYHSWGDERQVLPSQLWAALQADES